MIENDLTRARELMRDACEKHSMPRSAEEFRLGHRDDSPAITAIIAALTPPDGYVPATAVVAAATRLRRLASAASPLGRKAYIKAAEDIEMTVSAARTEVKP